MFTWPSVSYPFWEEASLWPCVHFMVSFAAYVVVQNYLLVLLFGYLFETLERLIERAPIDALRSLKRQWTEQRWDDSWVGDPLMNALGATVGALTIVDLHLFGFVLPPIYIRIIPFVFIALSTLVVDGRAHAYTLLLALVYSATTLLSYIVYWALSDDSQSTGARAAIVVSLLLPIWLVGIVTVPEAPPDGSIGVSVYRRVFIVGLLLIIVGFVLSLTRVAH